MWRCSFRPAAGWTGRQRASRSLVMWDCAAARGSASCVRYSGNKGAIACTLNIGGARLAFITAHLNAHMHEVGSTAGGRQLGRGREGVRKFAASVCPAVPLVWPMVFGRWSGGTRTWSALTGNCTTRPIPLVRRRRSTSSTSKTSPSTWRSDRCHCTRAQAVPIAVIRFASLRLSLFLLVLAR